MNEKELISEILPLPTIGQQSIYNMVGGATIVIPIGVMGNYYRIIVGKNKG